MLLTRNKFNDPPLEGMMYIGARINARYIELDDAGKRLTVTSSH